MGTKPTRFRPENTQTCDNFVQAMEQEDSVANIHNPTLVDMASSAWRRYDEDGKRFDPKIDKRDRRINFKASRVNKRNKRLKRYHY